MKNYIITIKTSKGETIEVPITATGEANAREQVDVFFEANYVAPDRQSYVIKDVQVV